MYSVVYLYRITVLYYALYVTQYFTKLSAYILRRILLQFLTYVPEA
jgi:hypothetical protein